MLWWIQVWQVPHHESSSLLQLPSRLAGTSFLDADSIGKTSPLHIASRSCYSEWVNITRSNLPAHGGEQYGERSAAAPNLGCTTAATRQFHHSTAEQDCVLTGWVDSVWDCDLPRTSTLTPKFITDAAPAPGVGRPRPPSIRISTAGRI